MHGGAHGSGAPKGNQNALKHGLYSKQLLPQDQDDFDVARAMEGLDDEIALLRLHISRHCQDPEIVIAALRELRPMILAKYRLSSKQADDLSAAIAGVLDQLGAAMAPPA